VIALAAIVAGIIAIFGVSAGSLAFRDLALLDAQQATEQAALGAAGRASFAAASGSTDAELDAIAQDEAATLATANVSRSTVRSVTAVRTSSPTELVRVEVALVADYSGLAGTGSLTARSTAVVLRSGP